MDISRLRKLFPPLSSGERIFLDNAATSLTPHGVISEVARYYQEYSVNVGRGAYRLSARLTMEIEETRQLVASFIGAQPDEIVFTSNTTDSLNKLAHSFPFERGDRIVLSIVEHHSNLLPWRILAKRYDLAIEVVPVSPKGTIDIPLFESVIKKGCRLAAVSACSNVLGTIQPIREMVDIVHNKGGYIALDAAQLVGHVEFNAEDTGCDFCAFSGHKMYGPTGTGVLYVRKGAQDILESSFLGGGTVKDVTDEMIIARDFPHRFEPGTPNIAGIMGFAKAIQFIAEVGLGTIKEHVSGLFSKMYSGLKKIEGVEVYTPSGSENTGIISLTIKGLTPHQAALLYDRNHNIMVRSGFHCAAPLVHQLGEGKGTVRASLALYNTCEEVDRFLGATAEIAGQA